MNPFTLVYTVDAMRTKVSSDARTTSLAANVMILVCVGAVSRIVLVNSLLAPKLRSPSITKLLIFGVIPNGVILIPDV